MAWNEHKKTSGLKWEQYPMILIRTEQGKYKPFSVDFCQELILSNGVLGLRS